MSIPISHFFSLLREVSIMAVGIQKEKVCVCGGGFFTSNGSGSTLIKMLDLVNESIACC